MSKKLISIVLSVLMVASMVSVLGASAFAASTADLEYEVIDGKATITGCNERADGTLVIPETINGYTVNAIADDAFAMCAALDAVSIPATVETIGERAFHTCTSLKSVTVYSSNVDLSSSGFGYSILNVLPGFENEFENAMFAYVAADKAYTESGYDPAFEMDFYLAYFELLNYAELAEDEYSEFVIDGVVINGYAGSTAEAYADNNGFTFVAIGDDAPVTPEVTPDEPVTPEVTPDEPVTDDNTDNDDGSSDDKVDFEIDFDFDSFSETISNLINTETLYKIVASIFKLLIMIASF